MNGFVIKPRTEVGNHRLDCRGSLREVAGAPRSDSHALAWMDSRRNVLFACGAFRVRLR